MFSVMNSIQMQLFMNSVHLKFDLLILEFISYFKMATYNISPWNALQFFKLKPYLSISMFLNLTCPPQKRNISCSNKLASCFLIFWGIYKSTNLSNHNYQTVIPQSLVQPIKSTLKSKQFLNKKHPLYFQSHLVQSFLMIQPLHEPTLTYKATPNEGECIIQEINPIKKSMFRFILYIILSICTAGLFALIVYWYPILQRLLIYDSSTLEQCSHFFILNYDGQYTIVQRFEQEYYPNQKQSYRVKGFVNRYMKYVIVNGIIRAIDFQYRKRIANIFLNPKQGLENNQVQNLRNSYGPGTMIIERPNIFILFGRQVFRPLYLFIVFSVTLWASQEYYYFAGVIFFTSAVSIGINLYQIRQLNEKIFHMAYYDIPIHVLRKDTVVQISSVDIVPGDIAFLKQAIKLPFEAVILEGSALINQCALTGESVPVVKKADVMEKYKEANIDLDKSAYVFQGTTIIQVNMKKKMSRFEAFREAYGIPVCVIRTNFVTLKGQLIRIISFPRQQDNQFQKQSTKFLLFLFSLSCASYCVLIIIIHKVVAAEDMVLKFLDLITITVPPGLPVSMTFGIIFAIEKLKAKQIFCISPNKIISGGRVKHACFDKTGTLTEDFMDFYGLVPCSKKKMYPFIESTQAKQGSLKPNIQETLRKNPQIVSALGNMAANHSIIQIENTGQLVGDPMEIKLFQFGQFELDASQNNPDVVFSYTSKRNHKGIIYRRFQFDSDVQRMSVVSSNSLFGEGVFSYCKGSPQIMIQIMNKSTVPDNYHEVLKQYASRGFRVLAIASKKITLDPKTIQRNDAETDLQFDGFQVFQNKLKKQSYDAIQDLKAAQISCVMITGDNPLTGSNIAYKCEIAHLNKKMIICDHKAGKYFSEQFFYHEFQINEQKRKEYQQKKRAQQNDLSPQVHPQVSKQNIEMIQMNGIELKTSKQYITQSGEKLINSNSKSVTGQNAEQFMKTMLEKAKKQNYQFCLTGSAFNELIGTHMETMDDLRKEFISHATVYARTKPNDKARIVSLYQNLGNIVLMCGDGANDCGALKQADVGLSLSQAEASISAPFTSKNINISAVVELIKQCRAGLATNFSLFNIMAIYSLIQYTSTIITQIFYSYPSDLQYLYWDLAGNFFFFLTFGYTGTVKTLTRHIPSSTLFSFSNLFQVVFMFVIQLIGQISMVLALGGIFNQDLDYSNTGGFAVNQALYLVDQEFIQDGPETNIIFLFTNFMYIFTVLAFSISKPWRKQFWTNIPFMIVLILVFVYSVLICMVPATRIPDFEISFMNIDRVNGFVLGIALLFSFFLYGVQKFIFEPGTVWLKKKYPQKTWI